MVDVKPGFQPCLCLNHEASTCLESQERSLVTMRLINPSECILKNSQFHFDIKMKADFGTAIFFLFFFLRWSSCFPAQLSLKPWFAVFHANNLE